MTTTLVNGRYTNEISAFRLPGLPTNPQPFLIALVDCIRQYGSAWICTDEGKALLFPVLLMAYGSLFRLDSAEEFERLDRIIPRA